MATLGELARVAGGELRGAEDLVITGVGSVEGARGTEIAPVEKEKFLEAARASRAAAFVVPGRIAGQIDRPAIVCAHPLAAFNRIIEHFGLAPPPVPPGIHPTAVVEDRKAIPASCSIGPFAVVRAGARIGARCIVESHVVIERDVVLGDDCRIEPGAVLHDGSRLGNRVRIGAHAVISRQGFGFAAGPSGPVLLHHVGLTVIEDGAHIGAATMIDRARFDETRVGAMSGLDNLIHVGHNARIGARTFLAAQVGLAGNARIGNDCEVGGQSGFGNHTGVGDRCKVVAKSGVMKLYPSDTEVFWYPSGERAEVRRMLVALRKLGRKERGEG